MEAIGENVLMERLESQDSLTFKINTGMYPAIATQSH